MDAKRIASASTTSGVINSTQFVGSNPSGTNTAIALTSARENFQFYANALLAPQRVFALSDEGLRLGTTIS